MSFHSCKEKDKLEKPKDHPTTYVMTLNNLPEGVAVDTLSRTITVPFEMKTKEIETLFTKRISVQDKDSKTSTDKGIKSIKVSKTKVSITLY
ncbi:MAG: hypothetical protein CR971_02070, partial [candidate division SR1 bacterium]